MQLGQLLVAHGLVDAAAIEQALARQRRQGGRLGDNLVELGLVDRDRLEAALHSAPLPSRSLADTGISGTSLLRLLLKAMAVEGLDTPSGLVGRLGLTHSVVERLLTDATEKALIEALGSSGGSAAEARAELRYGLSERGRQWAADALSRNGYVGPAPVSLAAYHHQIHRQRLSSEQLDRHAIEQAFSGLVIPETLFRKVGPAINSMRSILFYGAPGNGKTSLAERVGTIFRQIIYIPYCIEVEGQIIKLFDPSIHESVGQDIDLPESGGIRREGIDQRWVPCRRPVVTVGGELTLDMLDLRYNPEARFYEAPLHLKALNGTFVIDDFGRQQVRPSDLLNRWIVPLESRIDYLKLHTGKSFEIPFDEMVIFSTNMEPDDLMDPAFLRRIPYKLEIAEPTADDFRRIFHDVAAARGLPLDDGVIDLVIETLRTRMGQPLACYQPKFVCEQILAACKYEGISPVARPEFLEDALSNLFTHPPAR